MNNFALLLPEIIVAAVGFGVLTVDFFLPTAKKHWLAYLAVLGLGAVLAFTLPYLWGDVDSLYDGLIRVDGYALFFKAFFLVLGGFLILSSVDYVRRHLSHAGEYYGILVMTVVAMMLLASAGELLTAYIALELLSFGLYVLVAYDRYNPKSNEAGTKYIILGALSSAILLYGISQVYGLLGTTRFDEIAVALSSLDTVSPGLLVGIVMIIAGLGFKVAAVPFHMWAPDVYEGAPTPVTAHLAVGSKAAAFALILRFFGEALMPLVQDWQIVLIVLAALTMTVGNLLALVQTNIKRMLAYSSIGHVGYLLMGVAALAGINDRGEVDLSLSHLAANGIMLHLVAYGVTNLAAFLSISTLYRKTGNEDISGLAGAARRSPIVAMIFAVSMFSLAGLPIFAGFASKFYLFNAVASQGLLWLVGLAIFMSLVSLYYYLQVVRQMYVEEPTDREPIRVAPVTLGTLVVLLGGMVVLGVYPAPLLDAIQYASDAIFGAAAAAQTVIAP
jgi:NADH-quinone oxidoreductase subunit N